MSCHCSDCADYVCSRCKLGNETLQTLTNYFESIFLACLSNGLIQRKCNKQFHSVAKRKLCHELKERYREKLKRLSESQERATTAIRGITSTIAGLLAMVGLLALATVAASKLVSLATRTLAVIARPLPRRVSSTSRAICMLSTASIPTTSAIRT